MADSLPTISADQLTKAVSLAAAGTLAALDADNSEDECHNNDQDSDKLSAKKVYAQPLQTSLKLLETLSSSVTSDLAKLNQQINMQTTGSESGSSARKSLECVGRIKNCDGKTLPAIKKYSGRKNYKLLPPLMAYQPRAPSFQAKPDVVPRQIFTLSHLPNLRSPQELKSMPVRLARYTTGYLFLRSTTPSQNSSSAEKVDKEVVSKSLESPPCTKNLATSSLTAPVVTNVTLATPAPAPSASSKIMIPLLPRVLPTPQSGHQIPASVIISSSDGGGNHGRSAPSILRTLNLSQPPLKSSFPKEVGALKIGAIPTEINILYTQESSEKSKSLVLESQIQKPNSDSAAIIQSPVLRQESVSSELIKTYSGEGNSASCLKTESCGNSNPGEQTSLLSSKHLHPAAELATTFTKSSVGVSNSQTTFCDSLHQANCLFHNTGRQSEQSTFVRPNTRSKPATVPLNSDPSCPGKSIEATIQHSKVRSLFQSEHTLSNIRPPITPVLSYTVSPLNLSQATAKSPATLTSPPCVQVSGGKEPQISFVRSSSSLPVAISPTMIVTPPVFSKPASHLIWSTKQATDKSSSASTHSSSPTILHDSLKIAGQHLPISSTASPSNSIAIVGLTSPASSNVTSPLPVGESLNSEALKTESKTPSPATTSTSCAGKFELFSPDKVPPSPVHSSPVLASILSDSIRKLLLPSPGQAQGEVKYPASAHLQRNPLLSMVSSTPREASHSPLRAPQLLLRGTSQSTGLPSFTVINAPLLTKNPQALGKPAEKHKPEPTSSLAGPFMHPQASDISVTKSQVHKKIAPMTTTHDLTHHSSPAHFSTAAAVAAMVSLSETSTLNTRHKTENTSTNSPAPVTPVNEVGRVQSGTTILKEQASQFLIPSGDRTELVISPAGIQHLRLLLQKQGMSEGYFVITSPRAPVTAYPKCDTVNTVNSAFCETIPKNEQLLEDYKYTSLFQKSKSNDVRSCSSDKDSTLKSLTATSTLRTESKKNDIKERDLGDVHQLEPCVNTASKFEDSDSENSTSSVSRSSSTALVIETGDDDEQLDVGAHSSDGTAAGDGTLEQGRKSEEEINLYKPCTPELRQKSGRQNDDSNWDGDFNQGSNEHGCVPQSPLSLGDLIRQQQTRSSFSRHSEFSYLSSPDSKAKEMDEGLRGSSDALQLPSSVSEEFTFPMPICPTSSYVSMAHQHSHPEVHAGYQHSLYPSVSLFSNDISFDTGSNPANLDSRARQNIAEASSRSSSKMPPTPMSVPSPKSPLSVSSSQALDHNAPLNPPMTPNTMLINLLNRVPTPLLTNHQDLLSVPTSQENNIQHNEACLGNFEMIDSKRSESMFMGKRINYSDNVDQHQSGNESLLYPEGARGLTANGGKFETVQNGIELSYNPNPGENEPQMIQIDTQSDNRSSLQSYNGESFSHCAQGGGGSSIDFPENFSPKDHNHCHNFHCKSCSSPLVVTVNLDSHPPTLHDARPTQRSVEKSSELLENFETSHGITSSMNLQNLNCIAGSPGLSQNMAPQKSSDTDILRHLIMSTSSSTFHTMQPAEVLRGQHYEVSPSAFSLSQGHLPQASHFACQVESFLEPEDHHKEIRESSQSKAQNFSAQNDNFLHMDSHSHGRSTPSFDSTNTAFKNTTFSESVHGSYESPVTRAFGNEDNPSMGNQSNTSFIMQASLSNGPAYSVQDLSKSDNITFLGSDDRLQHLNEFRSDEHQGDMYYQHSQQGDLHQQATLHLYDPASQHQSHDLEYHMDSMPQPHQTHQYSTVSLSHPDPSRIFEDQQGNVGFMESQYSSQYYSDGNVPTDLPMFSQQCAVGSEAPVLGNTSNHPCNIPFSSAPTGLQLEFHFPTEDEDEANIEKQPVLPSASFSPPSVADQAVTPDPGGLGMYNGTFPNLSMYEMYIRGGNTDGRCAENEAAQEMGNFCVECNLMYKVQCKFHPCDYTYISDTPILSHARLTLPACLRVGTSEIVGHTNNTGVFAKETIAVRTKFGPLIGSPVSCDKLGSTRSFSLWQTFSGTTAKVVDTSDENSSNWLMFVKPARLSSEQNLVAFQHGSSVYFVTRVNIEPDQELLYWFSKDYARMLGLTANPKNAHHQLCPHCNVCKQVFPDRKQVRSHTRLQHPKPCTKKCSQCSRRFSQVSHLNAHITSVHLRVKKFVCSNCGKKFSDSSNFRKHVKSHSDERSFKCQLCGKSFRQKSHLMHHMNTHMPVKNEECGFCGERFTRAFTRKQHELQHTKQNKIQCTYCDKIFYKQQVYKQHLKIHSNERNYVCTHCNKAFRTKANLTRHGPACKQKKCILPLPTPSSQSTIAAPLHKAASTLPAEFIHPSHSDVTVSSYSNDTKKSSDSIQHAN